MMKDVESIDEGLAKVLDSLADILGKVGPSWHEAQFQDRIESALRRAAITYEREVKCSNGIVDFAVDAGRGDWIALEVKTQGSMERANRQLVRYLEDDRFCAGMLVTSKGWKMSDGVVGGKPVRLVSVWQNGF